MNEDEAWRAIEDYLIAINDERKFIDPLYQPLVGIVRAYQKAPKRKGPFALVTMVGSVDNGEADHLCYGDATVLARSRDASDTALKSAPVATEARVRSQLIRFRIDIYADQALNYANILRSAFLSSRALADLGGMLPRTVHNTFYRPELVGEVWEGRAGFEVELAMLYSETNAIDTIERGDIHFERHGATTGEDTLSYEKGN